MESMPHPAPSPDPAMASLSALIALRDQMQQLHAELEFLRLMLALRQRASP
jgi:hypothetical protein